MSARSRPIVQSHRPGDAVHITVDRNGTTRTATVVAGQGLEGPPLVRARSGIDQRDHLPRHQRRRSS